MGKAGIVSKKYPNFVIDDKDKSSVVTLDLAAYIKLLVKANITDKALWPPELEKGAEALHKIRQIEFDCIANHGEFDWEKLPENVQDEYDCLCVLLDELQDDGEQISWEEYKKENSL